MESDSQQQTSPRASTGDVVLSATNLSKRYGGTQALSDVSLELRQGGRVGLVGENGAGKSTLLGILNGTVEPDTGLVTVNGKRIESGKPHTATSAGVATVFQEQSLVPTLPVYQNIFLGRESIFTRCGVLKLGAMEKAAKALLEDLGIAIRCTSDTSSLPFAERQLVEIARAFALSLVVDAPPVILLDEPTSALTDHETTLLFNRMDEWRDKASFVFVSHKISDILRSCDTLVVMKDGVNLGESSTVGITEAELHELMVGRKRDVNYYKEPDQRIAFDENYALKIDAVSAARCSEVSFHVRPGEIVGIAGVLGSGKSEVVQVLAGAEKPSGGTIELASGRLKPGSVSSAMSAGVGYVPPERATEGLIPYASVSSNLSLVGIKKMRIGHTPFLSLRKIAAFSELMIEQLGIKPPRQESLCSELSGGNQQKVVIGKWLALDLKVFLLDDPTRGIDVGVKEEFYALIRQMTARGISFIISSDNLHELIGLSNRILVMRDGRVAAEVAAPPGQKPTEVDLVKHMV